MFQHVCLHQSTSLPSPNCCRSVGPLGPLPSSFPVPNNQFAFYPASLGQQAGWRNFRHISRKIMKTTTTTKKSSLGLGKIRQPKQEGNTQAHRTNPNREGPCCSGACCFLVLPGRQGHVNDACMHAFGEEKPFCCSCLQSNCARKKTSFVQSLGGAFFVEKQQSEERRSRES